jgi:hypothetical protein
VLGRIVKVEDPAVAEGHQRVMNRRRRASSLVSAAFETRDARRETLLFRA